MAFSSLDLHKSDVYVYIAGKYTDNSMLNTELNVMKAQELAQKCATHHINYYCSHMHSKLMNYYVPNTTYEYWMFQSKIALEKLCNCMLIVDNYEDSKGTKLEIELATQLQYPIFYTFEDFKNWVDSLKDDNILILRRMSNYFHSDLKEFKKYCV